MEYLVTAIGLALVAEGLLYGGFPDFAKRMAQEVQNLPETTLRLAGIGAMAVGVILVWLAHG